jgi:16S rRNA (guanine(966)-N(2))-methyltransferase RsmD
MRIVGGEYKGRLFHPGKNFRARPTTDFAKESLFNILENRYELSNLKVLDLFSGTGSISYEFASRGCQDITSVELDFVHFRFIKQVISELQIKAITPIKTDVFRFIEKSQNSFHLIFADPPYELPKLKDLPHMVQQSKLMDSGSIFILEHPKSIDFSSFAGFTELRKYGNVRYSFFEKPAS